MKYRNNKEIELVEKPKQISKIDDFFGQYKDPRWQKKRLKIMERDEFICKSCGNDGKTLNVHHSVPYIKNTKPWDYKDNELITLCNDCHKEISSIIEYCKLIIMKGCYCVDTAIEIGRIINEIEDMNINQLMSTWKIIKLIKKY